MGGEAIVDALAWLAQELTGEPQNDADANYAHKLSEEGHIDWSRATDIERPIRAFNPWPGTFTDLGEQRIRIHQRLRWRAVKSARHGTEPGAGRLEVACDTGSLKSPGPVAGQQGPEHQRPINGGKQVLLPGQELN